MQRLGDKVTPEQRSEGSRGERHVCIRATHAGGERGRGDGPDQGSLQHQQGQHGWSPASQVRVEDKAWEGWQVQVMAGHGRLLLAL